MLEDRMKKSSHLPRSLSDLVRGTQSALLQLLVAAAKKKTFARIMNCPTYPVPARTENLGEKLSDLAEILRSTEEYSAISLAKLYIAANTLLHRKGTGQFFTPTTVAEWGIAKMSLCSDDSICDAGAGTGIFAEALVKNGPNVQSYIGVESDPVLALCLAHTLESIDAPVSFRVWYANFLGLTAAKLKEHNLQIPNVIISNPPYIRFHNLRGRGRILASLGTNLGIKLSPLSGASNYFLCKAAELVNWQPMCAPSRVRLFFFLPRESAGAAHSRQLRDDLARKQNWQWREHT